MLLDERRLAGGSASLGRASLPGQFGGPELRYLRRGVHLPRRRQTVLRRPQYGRMPQRVRELSTRFEALARHLHLGAHAGPDADLQGAENPAVAIRADRAGGRESALGLSPARTLAL